MRPARGHPAPPVRHARQVAEHRRVRPEGLAARGRDAAHAVGPYQDQSVHPGKAAQLSSSPSASSGMAAVPWPGMAPWPTINAPMRNRL